MVVASVASDSSSLWSVTLIRIFIVIALLLLDRFLYTSPSSIAPPSLSFNLTQDCKAISQVEKLLDDTAKHWRKTWNEAPAKALTRIEEAAKQMIVVTTGLQELYIAIFA